MLQNNTGRTTNHNEASNCGQNKMGLEENNGEKMTLVKKPISFVKSSELNRMGESSKQLPPSRNEGGNGGNTFGQPPDDRERPFFPMRRDPMAYSNDHQQDRRDSFRAPNHSNARFRDNPMQSGYGSNAQDIQRGSGYNPPPLFERFRDSQMMNRNAMSYQGSNRMSGNRMNDFNSSQMFNDRMKGQYSGDREPPPFWMRDSTSMNSWNTAGKSSNFNSGPGNWQSNVGGSSMMEQALRQWQSMLHNQMDVRGNGNSRGQEKESALSQALDLLRQKGMKMNSGEPSRQMGEERDFSKPGNNSTTHTNATSSSQNNSKASSLQKSQAVTFVKSSDASSSIGSTNSLTDKNINGQGSFGNGGKQNSMGGSQDSSGDSRNNLAIGRGLLGNAPNSFKNSQGGIEDTRNIPGSGLGNIEATNNITGGVKNRTGGILTLPNMRANAGGSVGSTGGSLNSTGQVNNGPKDSSSQPASPLNQPQTSQGPKFTRKSLKTNFKHSVFHGLNQPISESSVGCKLLKQMGWTGGALGKEGLGITEPIKPGLLAGRQGLGYSKEKPKKETKAKEKKMNDSSENPSNNGGGGGADLGKQTGKKTKKVKVKKKKVKVYADEVSEKLGSRRKYFQNLPLSEFVIFESSTNAAGRTTAGGILLDSAKLSDMKLIYKGSHAKMKLNLGFKTIAEAMGNTRGDAKEKVSIKALDILRQSCPTLKVPKEGKYARALASQKSQAEAHFWRRMGRTEGNRFQQSTLANAVKPGPPMTATGEAAMDSFDDKFEGHCEPVHSQVLTRVQEFALSSTIEDLVFSPDFNKGQRQELHRLVEIYNLRAKSYGKKENKILVMWRRTTAKEIIDELHKEGLAWKYILEPPRSGSNPEVAPTDRPTVPLLPLPTQQNTGGNTLLPVIPGQSSDKTEMPRQGQEDIQVSKESMQQQQKQQLQQQYQQQANGMNNLLWSRKSASPQKPYNQHKRKFDDIGSTTPPSAKEPHQQFPKRRCQESDKRKERVFEEAKRERDRGNAREERNGNSVRGEREEDAKSEKEVSFRRGRENNDWRERENFERRERENNDWRERENFERRERENSNWREIDDFVRRERDSCEKKERDRSDRKGKDNVESWRGQGGSDGRRERGSQTPPHRDHSHYHYPKRDNNRECASKETDKRRSAENWWDGDWRRDGERKRDIDRCGIRHESRHGSASSPYRERSRQHRHHSRHQDSAEDRECFY